MKSQSQEVTALAIHWTFSCLAILLMLVRLIWRRISREYFNIGDYLTMAAVFCAVARLFLIHVVLIWGTSNVSNWYRLHHNFTDVEIYRRQVGSKLSLANRFIYNSYLWLQKLVLLDLYRRLIIDLAYEKLVLRGYLFIFFTTYSICQVITFTECRPFQLYWQIIPDPGGCAKAPIQLLVMGILNIVTDFALLILPIPIVAVFKAPWRRKIHLYVLFTLGIFIITITIIRLPINSIHIGSQVNRTTWASTELLTATIVVNAPSVYGLWNKRKRSRSEIERRRARLGRRHNSEGSSHPDTIGGSNPSDGRRRMRKPSGRGELLDKDFLMTEICDSEGDAGTSYESPRPLWDDVENASRHSSQLAILHN